MKNNKDLDSAPQKKPRPQETTLYGLNACLAAFDKRPQDIQRFFFSKNLKSKVSPIKKWCADHRLPYREIDDESLLKVTGSVHHEGIALVLTPSKPQSIFALLDKQKKDNSIYVALDKVQNPHNAGAVLRSSAYFDVSGLIVEKDHPLNSSSAMRTAEGAREMLPLYECKDLASALRDLKGNGFLVMGGDTHSSESLYDTPIETPLVVVVGNENEGLTPRVKKRCDRLVRIPGNSRMQSLNASVALGVLLSECRRRLNT